MIFGTALGILRSEVPDVDKTVFIMSPQIVGAVQDGDTLAGKGFTAELRTDCQCTTKWTLEGISNVASHLSPLEIDGLMQRKANLTQFGMLNHVLPRGDDTIVTSVMLDSPLCGGAGIAQSTAVPICNTRFWNHTKADILVEYMVVLLVAFYFRLMELQLLFLQKPL